MAKRLAGYLPINELTLEHLSYLSFSTYPVSLTNYTQPKPLNDQLSFVFFWQIGKYKYVKTRSGL
jgi:hypothetical protein